MLRFGKLLAYDDAEGLRARCDKGLPPASGALTACRSASFT